MRKKSRTAKSFKQSFKNAPSNKKLQQISLVVFDVDGILTDGLKYYSSKGVEYKTFHAGDGLGIYMLIRANIHVVLISNDRDKIMKRRSKDIGVDHVYTGIANKAKILASLMRKWKLSRNQILYMGDDLWDLPAFEISGIKVTVPDAPDIILERADWIAKARGGHGAVREVADKILTAKKIDVCKLIMKR